jgi:hypothetical protein
VRCRLIRVDWNEKRIGLSLRGIAQPDPSAVAAGAAPEHEAEEVAPESVPEQAEDNGVGDEAGDRENPGDEH